MVHPDGFGRGWIDALEGDVVGAGRPLERGHANQVTRERAAEDRRVGLADRLVRRLGRQRRRLQAGTVLYRDPLRFR